MNKLESMLDFRGLAEWWVRELQAEAWLATAMLAVIGGHAAAGACWCAGTSWWPAAAPMAAVAVICAVRARRTARLAVRAGKELEARWRCGS